MPVTFTVTALGASVPPVRKPKAPLAPLGKFWRTWTSSSTYEVTAAITEDGRWIFERAGDGTWGTGHLPTETVVRTGFRTLRAARVYAGSGKAQAVLDRIQTAAKGEGNG